MSSIKNKYDKSNINYKFIEFTNDSDEIYNGVDLAITRGGASTLSELSFLNIPFVSIPFHQQKMNINSITQNIIIKNCCC